MRKYLIYSLLLVLLGVGLVSCEEDIVLELDENDVQLVVEGRITDQPGPHSVFLSKTVGYFSDDDPQPVSGATVTLSDRNGNQEVMSEVAPGEYQTVNFQPVQLEEYTLTVEDEGEIYTATSAMPRLVSAVDSLSYQFLPPLGPLEAGFYLTANGREQPGSGDFYQFLLTVNDSLYNAPEDLLFVDDKVVDGQNYEFLFPYPLEVGDTAVVEVRSLTEQEYDFLVTLVREIFTAGNPFGSPPANLAGNISNGGQGYFSVNAVVRDTIVIQ